MGKRHGVDWNVLTTIHAVNGGCPKDRFATSPYGEPGQHYLCPGYKDFFYHIAKPADTMAGLLRGGRAPAELMAIYAAQDSWRGRNDPLPLRQRPQMEALPRRQTRRMNRKQ